MKFKEVLTRVTGFSIPIFGVQWNPTEPQIAIAKRVISFLEDRRVLFNEYELEIPDHCIKSVIEIRGFLTEELGKRPDQSSVADQLRAMRAACRKFLDDVGSGHHSTVDTFSGGPPIWSFCIALGELRSAVGLRLSILASMHGLPIDGQIVKILPVAADPESEFY